MEAPYTLYSAKERVKPDPLPEQLAKKCRYFVPFAQEIPHYKVPKLELISQQSNYYPFFIDVVEIEAKAATYIPFDIHDKQLYMYFTLKGSLLYTTDRKEPIIKTQANTFLMSYYDRGAYFAYAQKGKHIAIVISMHHDWIESISQKYHNIQWILYQFRHSGRPYETMNQCKMDREIHRWLFKIYNYSKENRGALDGNLRKYISLLLEHYDSILGDQESDLAFKIKTFLEANYFDPRLNIKFLSDHFHVTPRTLRNIFKRRYHLSVLQFYTNLRIENALLLMAQKGIGIKDVYMQVGYTDERTFRYALEAYQKRLKSNNYTKIEKNGKF